MSDELAIFTVVVAGIMLGAAVLALLEGHVRRPWFLRRHEYNEIRRWRRPS